MRGRLWRAWYAARYGVSVRTDWTGGVVISSRRRLSDRDVDRITRGFR